MAGEKLADLPAIDWRIGHVAVKEAVFPWGRSAGVDPVLSPEMKSTGEVMGIVLDFTAAFGKSQLGAGVVLPDKGTLFVSVKASDKHHIVPEVMMLAAHGFKIVATGVTPTYLLYAGETVENQK